MVIIMTSLNIVPIGIINDSENGLLTYQENIEQVSVITSSASGTGNDGTAMAYISRTIVSQNIDIANSYTNTNQHTGHIDLSSFLIPGWNLYQAEIQVNSIGAIAERESTDIIVNSHIDTGNQSGLVFDALYQAFYNQNHDGKLENYTFSYIAPYYTSSLGDAFLGVRSDYSDSQTNVTSWITPFSQVLTNTVVAHDVSSDNAILNSNTFYYVVIDGTTMTGIEAGGWRFNTIYWSASSSVLGVETGYHIRDDKWYLYEGLDRKEAELKYTYIPWNKTANSALEYSDPSQISLTANLTPLSGLKWIFYDNNNLTRINFGSTQSAKITYDLVLSYKKSIDTSSVWKATESGQNIKWNTSLIVSYPSVSESKFLNISIPTTRVIIGLFNSSYPSINHDNYENLNGIIRCSEMDSDTWTLVTTSYNFLTSIRTYNSADDREITSKTTMDVNIDINATLIEQDLDIITTGIANLTVYHSGSQVWNPTTQTVSNGATHYRWDIGASSIYNGLYRIEEFWSNGTEAGYRSVDLILYYPTTLVADKYQINGFTDNSVDISVDFNDVFTPQGLNSTFANIFCSFDGEENRTLVDQAGGTWTASILTTGKSPGTYPITVYAEGYALENQSLIIYTTLIHETNDLVIQWTNTDSISFVESTELRVVYERVDSISIPNAIVNVTVDTTTLYLRWNEELELYNIIFNGSDSFPGFGVHNLIIQAWRVGYEAQSNNIETLTISEETTSAVVTWSNSNSITYVESTILYVDYLMSNATPITGALVNVTIGTDYWILAWSETNQKYIVEFNGDDIPPGLGVHSISIQAYKYGYEYQIDSSATLTLSEEQTTLVITWSNGNNITYTESTTLIANYTMSDGSSIKGASVTATIGTDSWSMTYNLITEVYELVLVGSSFPPGFGSQSVTIEANRFGFISKTDLAQTFTKTVEPTTMTVSWSNGNDITFVEQTSLIITFRMSDNTPISGGTINVTIDGTLWSLTWHEATETYRITFYGFDNPPGFGLHSITIRAWKFGFEGQENSTETLTLSEEPTTLVISWTNTADITYIESTTLIVDYQMSDTSPITGALVNVSIGGKTWELVWHAGSQTYSYTFLGSDDPPGFGSHGLVIEANRFGFRYKNDSSQTLILSEESTSIQILWTESNTITYVQSTYLSVNYTDSNGAPIGGAWVNATINGIDWTLSWNIATETYQVQFTGTDEPPGIGTHSITIMVDLFGYVSQTDSSQTLTIQLEPTSMIVSWIPDNDITFVTYSILAVSYRMSNGITPISGATVNATIAGTPFLLSWSGNNQDYRLRIEGNDVPPGFGTHLISIQAALKGFVAQGDSSHTVTLREEPTSMMIHWSNGNDIGFFEHTYLFVDYRMSNLTTILDATLLVTIDGHGWPMSWNATAGKYQIRFEGSDSPPGVGTHSLTIHASKFGYIEQVDTGQTLILPVVPTNLIVEWTNGNDISYVQSTTLRVTYEMYNSSVITNGTLNVTIGTDLWVLSWNGVSQAYEFTFSGNNVPPGFGNHSLTILAWKKDFQGQTDFSERLTLSIESTNLVITWTNGNDITYFSQTTLSVAYVMSNATPIHSATLNTTIGGVFWELIWNPLSEAYEITLFGSDHLLGYGTHEVVIEGSLYGFEYRIDTSQDFSIRLEDTTLTFQWVPSNSISYIEETTLRIFYRLSNGTPVLEATVNITLLEMWIAVYNSESGAYEVHFRGTDEQPGLGIHTFVIRAWKYNYLGITDITQILTIVEEETSIHATWTDGNDITYSESTTLLVNYTMSNGTEIPEALVEVTIDLVSWSLTWDPVLELYTITFYELGPWPSLGTHGLVISGYRPGYETAYDTSQTLTIHGELGEINSYWLGDGTITYVESVTLVVNYTLLDGAPIDGATVNVTISGELFDLTWHPTSETYRITFNGSDSIPGLGTFSLQIRAWRYGFDGLIDSTKALSIIKEPTSLIVTWSNSEEITYFEHTFLFVRYRMSNSSDILGAMLNVTIDGTLWALYWNSTQEAYGIRFSGSDVPPGFGTHNLTIRASKYGFVYAEDTAKILTISKDPSSIEVYWSNGSNITYVESTTLIVYYRMSNGTPITTGQLNVTIGSDVWALTWNVILQAYETTFNGDMNPPGLGSFSLFIQASGDIYYKQEISTLLVIREEPTVVVASWSTKTFDWTQNAILSVEYRDSYGIIILDAIQKEILIDGTSYSLIGTNGTYWFEFNNSLDLGLHFVIVNLSKYGYQFAVNSSISFRIIEADTELSLLWSSTTIDYLGHIDLVADYVYVGSGLAVLVGEVIANITIDGTIVLPLQLSGDSWLISLDKKNLDLGTHTVIIRVQAYGYVYQQVIDSLTVNEVLTDSLVVVWTPSNKTIQYTDSIILTMDYTYYGGDVPDNASVSVTLNGYIYELEYILGSWTVSIPGSDLGIGLYNAEISASLYGYVTRTQITTGINVTLAANSFIVSWEPATLIPTYIDTVNVSVIYTQDFKPINGSSVKLYINGSVYDLIYSPVDEKWHLSVSAATIDLGIWNVTIVANKTGYAEGYYSNLLEVVRAHTTLIIVETSDAFYYDEDTYVDIYYQLTNLSTVPDQDLSFTLEGIEQPVTWNSDSWRALLEGIELGVGIHEFTVIVSAYGYEPQIGYLSITVLEIPTRVLSDDNRTIYALEQTSFTFTYLDDRTNMSIVGLHYTNWTDTYDIVVLPNGTIIITIGQMPIHVGTYTFEITFVQVGYENATGSVNVYVYPIPTELVFLNEYITQYENETVSIEIRFIDTAHEIPVNWGEIVIDLGGVAYYTTYNEETSSYTVSILLTLSIEPGTYYLSIIAEALDCLTSEKVITLDVLPKKLYEINISIEEEIIAGETSEIIIIVKEDGASISGVEITVVIIIAIEGREPQTIIQNVVTDSEGLAIISFEVPLDATWIHATAEFNGSISEWPTAATPFHANVLPPETIRSSTLFENPIILSIIVGGVSLPLLALGLRLRRRNGIEVSTTTKVASASTPTIVPIESKEIGQRLRNEISSSETGFTRAELSQRLGLSGSKTGILVKDLLATDSKFYEVREGTRRLLKYRKSE